MASDTCPGGVDGRKCCPDCEHTAGPCSGCALAAPSLPPGGEILSALVHAVTGERPAEGTITAGPVTPPEPGKGMWRRDVSETHTVYTNYDPTPDVLTVSTSEARTLSTCKRRYYFEYKLGRRPRDQGHEAVWGAALHRGLESYYRGMLEAAGYGVALDLRLAVCDMLAAALSPGVDSQGRPYEPPADPYARAALSAILRAYVEYWWTDEQTYEVVAVELPFKLPVKTRLGRLIKGKLCEVCESIDGKAMPGGVCPVCFGAGRIRPMREGRIDLVLREREGEQRTWITEHKSTGWAPTDERYYAGIMQDLQIALYYDAARELGLTPAGVMYDVIRRPDYDEVKPPPKMKLDGQPRAPRTVECEACDAGLEKLPCDCGQGCSYHTQKCSACSGTGRVVKNVAYSNPRHGERPAEYEERVYRLATGEETRSQWFGRRHLPITEKQVTAAREIMHNGADEIRWREKTGHWPEIGDRYVCAAPRKVCPWLDVCEGRASATDDRLFPLKIKKEGA